MPCSYFFQMNKELPTYDIVYHCQKVCNSQCANCNSVSSAGKSVLPVGNHQNSVSLTRMHTVSCHSHLTSGLKALTTSDTEFCASDTHFQWCPKSAILEKSWPSFPRFFYINYLGIFKWVAHFLVGIQGLWCVKTYLSKTGVAFFPFSTGFSISVSAGCTKSVTHFEKKIWVALNLAFCRGESDIVLLIHSATGYARRKTEKQNSKYWRNGFSNFKYTDPLIIFKQISVTTSIYLQQADFFVCIFSWVCEQS